MDFALFTVIISSLLHSILFDGVCGFTPPSSDNQRLVMRRRNAPSPIISFGQHGNEDISPPTKVSLGSDDSFLHAFFGSTCVGKSMSMSISECDDMNIPPSLGILRRSLADLASGSDIRGTVVGIDALKGASTLSFQRSTSALAKAIQQSTLPALTPFAAECFGYAFATMMKDNTVGNTISSATDNDDDILASTTICVGQDPRWHGSALAEAFRRGAESVPGIQVISTGLSTTPSMFEFCRAKFCDGAVMITASHLPKDRNGFKFFFRSRNVGGASIKNADDSVQGFTSNDIQTMISIAQKHAIEWYDKKQHETYQTKSSLSYGSHEGTVSSNGMYMEHYASTLANALIKEVSKDESETSKRDTLPLQGLKIVVNAGNGSGGFFADVLEQLGADVKTGSMHLQPDGHFPNSVPNPENPDMISSTIKGCQAIQADLGILLDTDADRCGFVAPSLSHNDIERNGVPMVYEAINRNRLIALMGVIFAQQAPGCSIVTCSVTSEGLSAFLTNELKLDHVRYLKGYANVIRKAKELTESGQANAEVAIETSGHCALKENDYLDDGTYTAVKTIALLAREKRKDPTFSLLQLIENMAEMDETAEIRLNTVDGTLSSTSAIFDLIASRIEDMCIMLPHWKLDMENLEGIRVSIDKQEKDTCAGSTGTFFMLRKSLHDPLLSLQIEAESKQDAQKNIVGPILSIFESDSTLGLEFEGLKTYCCTE